MKPNTRLCDKSSNSSVNHHLLGDILFSTVAGGPAYVHSPHDCYNRSNGSHTSLIYEGKPPVSLSHCLLDPNIELPTITVCEVDAVLRNISLPRPIVSNSGRNKINSKNTITGRYSVDAAKLSHSASPSAHTSKDSLEGSHWEPLGSLLLGTGSQTIPSVSRRALSLSIDGHCKQPCERTSESLSQLTTNDSRTPKGIWLSSINEPSFSKSHINTDAISIDPKIYGECMKKIVISNTATNTVNPPKSARIANTGSLLKDSSFMKSDATQSSLMNNSTEGNRQFRGLRLVPLIPVSRTPFGGLDLAMCSQSEQMHASNQNDCAKRREANLSVRIANQVHLLSSRNVESEANDAITTVPKKLETVNKVLSKVTSAADATGQRSQPLINPIESLGLPSCISNERFKYSCPHPRCGRRYQAEPSLARHLNRYHGEPIELSRRRQPRSNNQRRPASEERSRTRDAIDTGSRFSLKSPNPSEPCTPVDLCKSQYSTKGMTSPSSAIGLLNSSPTSSASDGRCSVETQSRPGSVAAATAIPTVGFLPYSPVENRNRKSANISYTLLTPTQTGINVHTTPSVGCQSPASISETATMLSTDSSPLRLRSASGGRGSWRARVVSVNGWCSNRSSPAATCPQLLDHTESGLERKNGASSRSNDSGSEDREGTGRRRTRSTGAADSSCPGLTTRDSVHSECPCCGFGLTESDAGRRQSEWMSGIRALTYSKTDPISCPMDGCQHVCQGRSDLSAHLTRGHFPDVKDCQMVCADEKNFQAHFNRHLFGYLPGDLSGLFPSVLSTCERANNQPSIPIIPCSHVNDPAPSPSHPPAASSTISSRIYTAIQVPTGNINGNNNPIHSPTNPNPFAPDETVTMPFAPTGASSELLTTSILPTQRLSHNSTVTTQSIQPSDYPLGGRRASNSLPISRLVVRTDTNGLFDWTTTQPVGTGIGSAHVDLTDHHNLLSALDLIPDDLLMELLNEDRPGLWGDTGNATTLLSNPATYSAPHAWQSPDQLNTPPSFGDSLDHTPTFPPLRDQPISSTIATNAAATDPVVPTFDLDSDVEVDVVLPVVENETQRLPIHVPTHVQRSESTSTTSSLDDHSWVPPAVVNHTWSLAMANERTTLSDVEQDDCVDHAHDCPRLVLSDLAAALILPDVERQLKASLTRVSWDPRTEEHHMGMGDGTVGMTTSTCDMMSQSTTTLTATKTTPTSSPFRHPFTESTEQGGHSGRRTCLSGKRRRNASSNASPNPIQWVGGTQTNKLTTGRPTEVTVNGSMLGYVGLPSKWMRHVSGSTGKTTDGVGREQLPICSLNGIDTNPTAPEPLAKRVPQPNGVAESLRVPYCSITPPPSTIISAHSSPLSVPCVNHIQKTGSLDSSFTAATTIRTKASPRHLEIEPKKRRRNLRKGLTVCSTADSLSVSRVSDSNCATLDQTVLPRRHSMIHYNNLIAPTHLPN